MANKKEWWIYKGKDTEDGIAKLKIIEKIKPEWRKGSESDHNAEAFVPFGDEVLDAVNAAIYLRRPLLVTGEPGIGKSTLAKQLALKLTESRKVLNWDITSKSTLKDALYSYDALTRLHDIQMKKLYFELKNQKDNEEIKEYADINTGIENYLKLGPVGTAFILEKPTVVLIDEIDKSDLDLPNDLLHIFEEQRFEIPELKRLIDNQVGEDKNKTYQIEDTNGVPQPIADEEDKNKIYQIEDAGGVPQPIADGIVKCRGDFPIIVMTSNGEREFPSAFLRRCISVHLAMPEDRAKKIALLTDVVEAHFSGTKENTEITKVIESFVDLKDEEPRSNDQLLNAVYLVLNARGVEGENFADRFDKSVWYPVR